MVKDDNENKEGKFAFDGSFLADMNIFMTEGLSAAVIAFLNKNNLKVADNGKVSYAFLFSQAVTAEFNEGYGEPEYKGEELPFKEGSLKFDVYSQLQEQCGGMGGLFILYEGPQKQMFAPVVRTVTYLETLKFLDERTAEAIEIYNDCIK